MSYKIRTFSKHGTHVTPTGRAIRQVVKSTAILIMGAMPVQDICHIPQAQRRASKEVVKSYVVGKWYDPSRSHKDWLRSEERKQILQNIAGIRKAIRNQAEVYYRDRDTKMIATTANQKTIIHSERLMQKLSTIIS